MHTGRPAAANWAVMSSKPSAVIESPMKSTPLGLASAAWHWTYGVWSTVDAAAKAAGATATVAAANRAAITMATKCGLGTRMILWHLSVPWETFRVPEGAPTGCAPIRVRQCARVVANQSVTAEGTPVGIWRPQPLGR